MMDKRKGGRSPKFEQDLEDLMKRSNLKFVREAKNDLLPIFSTYPDLQPDIENFQFSQNEPSRYVFSIGGTIPITYKNQQYNIPVGFYFLDNHPYAGPWCYVKPTSSMKIKPNKNIDDKGRIYLPYLTEWRYGNYDTPALINVIQYTFQEKCPVFSVVPQPSSNNSPQNNPPYPSVGQPVAQPPYPMTTPYSYPNPSGMPQPYASSLGGGGGYNPYPQQQTAGGYQPPYPSFSTPEINNPPVSQGPLQPLASAGAGGKGVGGYGGYSTGTIQPPHIRASILSAIEDKIKKRLREKIGDTYAEIQSIDTNSQELFTGKKKLKDMVDELEREHRQMDSILSVYKAKKEELDRVLKAANVNGKEEPDPEDAIDAASPLHRQILSCYVQECAIDETIYTLGQALKEGTVIDIKSYLKHVRELSRRQFVARATLIKARSRAGLPT